MLGDDDAEDDEPPPDREPGDDDDEVGEALLPSANGGAALCGRCQRVGKVRSCDMCAALHRLPGKKPVSKADDDPDADGPKDQVGTVLPKKCRGAYLDPFLDSSHDLLVDLSQRIRDARLSDGIEKRAKHYPFLRKEDYILGVGFIINYLDDLIGHYDAFRPFAVCPECHGAGCPNCLQSGLVPAKIYQRLTEAVT